MYHTLLVLHLFSVAAMVAAMTYFTALYFGAPAAQGAYRLANVLVGAGAGLALVFGVWLALYLDQYEIWDPWILGSIVLWAVAGGTGSRAGKLAEQAMETAPANLAEALRGSARLHWIAVAATFGILILMIFKPGA
jgi:hypothetical protein